MTFLLCKIRAAEWRRRHFRNSYRTYQSSSDRSSHQILYAPALPRGGYLAWGWFTATGISSSRNSAKPRTRTKFRYLVDVLLMADVRYSLDDFKTLPGWSWTKPPLLLESFQPARDTLLASFQPRLRIWKRMTSHHIDLHECLRVVTS